MMPSGFQGMRVIAFDSEHLQEIEQLILQYGGTPLVVDHSFDNAIDAMVAGEVDVVLFTDPGQITRIFQQASQCDRMDALRNALRQITVGSLGPTCTEALRTFNLGAELEPDQIEITALVREMARLSDYLVKKKRSAVDAGVDTTQWRRVDMVWPTAKERHNLVTDSAFLRACRCEPTDYTPVWLLRQAGRYQRAYREIRSKVPFLDMCKTPELTAEITLMAAERLGVDAAIIFADILPILQPMGFDLEFVQGKGPVIHNPIRLGSAIDQLAEVDPDTQAFVYEAIRMTRRALPPTIPLIGFSGAPYTLAAYAIEGGSSKTFEHTKILMYGDPGAWHALMEKFSRAVVGYLNEQIAAGAQVVQLFDSWVGSLSPDDYREFVLPHSGYIFAHLTPGVPAIHFGTNTGALLELMREAGGDVIGLDWRVDLAEAWERLGYDVAVQGNLDPIILFSSPDEIRKRAKAILHKAENRPGHIFNIGHGILPGIPEDHVTALVDAVHEYRG